MKPKCYNRQGEEIEVLRWAALKEDDAYVTIGEFQDRRIRISTVWTGTCPSFGPRHIFETMIFVKEHSGGLEGYHQAAWKWRSEEEARRGHEVLVCCYMDDIEPDEPMEAVEREFDRRLH